MDNFSYMGHLSQSAFPVAYAITEKRGASGIEFLESFICSQEVSGRLSAHLASGPLQGHMLSFIHRVGAAVATVKLYRCKREVIANAISIAISAPEHPMFPSSFSPDTKVTCVSGAAVEGMRSAFLAMEGLQGTLDIIEHPAGFIRSFSSLSIVPDIWGTLGKTWVMDSVSFKYYASCGYSQGPVNAVLNAIGPNSVLPHDIKSIHLHCPILTVVMENFSTPHYRSGLSVVNINFSSKRSVSAAIIYQGLDGSFFANSNDELHYDAIDQLSRKVFIHHSWKHTLDMIMGMDACLEHAGYPGVFDTGTSDKTLKKLRAVYRNRTLFSKVELVQLMNLPGGYLRYLLRRMWRSLVGKMGWSDKSSREVDLSKLKFAIGTSAELLLSNGTVLKGTCDIPKGFAGDPCKRVRVLEKFERECYPVYGPDRSKEILKDIMDFGFPSSIQATAVDQLSNLRTPTKTAP
ncbi:MAG: MmgE/PrpD family protein [Chryseolinea sp.]